MILAIDPGTTETAFCKIDGTKIIEMGKLPNDQIVEVIRRNKDSFLAVEMIASYGMPVGKEVFETCLWIGRFLEAHGGPYRLVYRKEVTMHLCNSFRAGDSNVRKALIDKFGPPGVKKNPGRLYGLKNDIWSAFAVGITALETVKEPNK